MVSKLKADLFLSASIQQDLSFDLPEQTKLKSDCWIGAKLISFLLIVAFILSLSPLNGVQFDAEN